MLARGVPGNVERGEDSVTQQQPTQKEVFPRSDCTLQRPPDTK
jgi:hypothetical protein